MFSAQTQKYFSMFSAQTQKYFSVFSAQTQKYFFDVRTGSIYSKNVINYYINIINTKKFGYVTYHLLLLIMRPTGNCFIKFI